MAAATPMRASADKTGSRGSPVSILLRIAVLAVLVGGSVYLLMAHAEWFDNPRLVKAEVLSWGVWGPIAFVLLYAIGPSFLVPGAVMTMAGGLAFGALWGSVYSILGADVGALVAFGAGRFLGKSFVQWAVPRRFDYLVKRLARQGFYIILYLRIFPIIPYNALNLLAGAAPISFRDYFWASVIGMIPGTILFAFLGDALWHPASPRFFLTIGLIAACFTAAEVYRRKSSISIDPC